MKNKDEIGEGIEELLKRLRKDILCFRIYFCILYV